MSRTTASNPAGKASAVGGTGKIAPEILWAQRSSADEPEKNLIMLTINVPNLPSDPTLNLTKDGFHFAAKAGNKANGTEEKEYEFKLDFYDQIDVENSKRSQTSKSLYLVLRKAEAKEEFWPRLTKEKVRLHNVKTDFDKWVDEDEQEGDIEDVTAGMGGMGGMDPSMMGMGGGAGGMPPGMGGAGGMDLQAMMQQMQGAGGGGMPGGMDLQSMMSQMGGAGMDGNDGDDDDDVDDDDDDEDEDGPKFDASPETLTEAERAVDSID